MYHTLVSAPCDSKPLCSQSDVAHASGLCHRVHLLNWLVSLVEEVPARSCSAVNVSDSTLGGVPTRVFQPRGGQRLKRGVIYFHGGGWALASARESPTNHRDKHFLCPPLLA